MANFVLVHGSGQNAQSWSRVCDVLRARGHSATAPDLHDRPPGWGLDDYAREIARSIHGPDTVLVGHSFSGAFLPLVPETSDCGLLVFFAAVIPEPGKSVRQQFEQDPSMFAKDWIEAGKRWFDDSDVESLAKEFLFHDCDEETLPWALGTLRLLDTHHLVTHPSPFTEWPSVPTASIVATGDRTLTPEWGRRTTRRVLGGEAIEMRAGHCPHVSRPDATADVLERLATQGAT